MTDPNNNQDSVGGKAGANTVENKGLGGPNFDSLYLQKRSTDPESVERRERLADQRPPPGVIGSLMQKFVSGPGGPNTSQK